MTDFIKNLTGFLGETGSGTLANALIGLAILIVGLILVKIITGIFKRILSKVSFLTQTNADGSATDLSIPIASLIKGLLTNLFLWPFYNILE